MEVECEQVVIVKLTMAEARQLKDLVQNPLYEDELPDEESFRQDLFEGLLEKTQNKGETL